MILKVFDDPINILMIVVFLYITLITYDMHLSHYDSFSHWGLVAKIMLNSHRFPNFENNYILLKGYQPGSACFIYFFGFLCGKTEDIMIMAQNYLIFGFLSVFLHYIKGDNKILKCIMFIAFYVLVLTSTAYRANNLLVDSLIGVIALIGIIIVYEYINNLKSAFIYSLPVIFYLFLVKNMSLILIGVICLYFLYIAYKNKEIKQGIKYIFIIGAVLLINLLIWHGHISTVYGHWALNTKHCLSLQNVYTSLKSLGISNLKMFIVLYIKHLFNLKNNHANIYMLVINAVFVIYSLLSSDKKKSLKFLGLMNLLYLGYYVLLGGMYILSMPLEEAVRFAGYERYIMTIIILILGILIINFYCQKKSIKYEKAFIIISICALLLPLHYFPYEASFLKGEKEYPNSYMEKVDKLIDDIPLDKENYYIYAPNVKEDDFLKHIFLYRIEKLNINVVSNSDDLNDIISDAYLILYDDCDEEFDNFEKINNVVYYKG